MRWTASPFAARMFTGLVVFGADRVVGRWFGPETFGAYKTLANVRIGVQALALVYAANTFFVARDKRTLAPVASNSLVFSAVAGGAVALALCVVAVAVPRWTAPLPLPLALLFLATAPAILACFLESAAFLGAGWIGAWNAPIVANRVVIVVGLGAAGLLPALRLPATAVATVTAAEIVGVAVTFAILSRHRLLAWRFDAPLWGKMTRYGLIAWTHALLGFALLKGDLLLVGALSGNAEAGQFGAGMEIRDGIMFLPWIASMLLLPRVAGSPSDRGAHARALALPTLAIAGTAGALAFAFAPEVISVLYGAAYGPAVPVARVLIPAALLCGYAHLMFQDLLGRGAPRVVVTVPALTFALALAANLVAIPRAGALGAAWVSLGMSATLAVLVTLAFRRHLRRPSAGLKAAAPAAGTTG